MGIPAAELTPKVQNALMTLMAEVDALRKDLETSNRRLAELERLADMDPLTPIVNRRAFVRETTRMLSFAERYDVPLSVLFFDLNGLKSINDTFGHAGGDAAILHAAEVLRAHVRESDVVGRLGGDEFAVLLSHSNHEQAHIKAEQLSTALAAEPCKFQEHDIAVSAAFGAYTFKPGEDVSAALANADRRMYQHKQATKSAGNV